MSISEWRRKRKHNRSIVRQANYEGWLRSMGGGFGPTKFRHVYDLEQWVQENRIL